MKTFSFIFALISMVGTIHLCHAQSSSAQYISSIKPASPQQAVLRSAITDVANSIPETALTSTKVIAENEDAETAIRTSIRSANYVEFGSVGFHANATIMTSSSESLMLSLSQYLLEHPDLRLRIHGYCNNNAPRTIIALGNSSEFFVLHPDNQLKTVTAKELSEMRAESARLFLIRQGICPDRIDVVGEGGNRMIYPQTSQHAHYNDRVEFRFADN